MTYLCISVSDSSSQNLSSEFSHQFLGLAAASGPANNKETFTVNTDLEEEETQRIQHFKESIGFIHECRLHGGGCLIHCLAGVSRSTTILVAYLMTVTDLSWEECLAATRVVRSYVSPNFGFQQQLQEYEMTLLKEYRAWVRQEYGKNPFNDQEELQRLITEQEKKQREQQLGSRENHWINSPTSNYPLPYNAYGTSSNRWMNR
ncbi:dual specificity protein phosphatase 22-A isoform X2 [Chelonia mydas]|uniref:dual specificity protein phosphatase 22-A isoform X2 n=1 Tax=Chelonia mydas TaxID=8469 RepID=UPI0018A21169|nr:dual specificity protein phosphatase 22-A isoform X2 [Chelonia mydas]